MSEHQAMHPIGAMGPVLGVSTSGYSAWRKHGPAARSLGDRELTEEIRR